MPDTTTPSSHLGLYRSGITGPEHRRYITVGRQALVEDTIEILQSNAGKKPKHHQLFVGPRGMGKTHLLSLVEDEISQDEALSKAYHVARFPEESNRTLSFADFLLGLVEILRDTLPEEGDWKELHDRLATEMDDKIIIDTLVPVIRNRYRQTGQSIVVMMENLNQVFDQQIKDGRSIAAIRGFFMESNGCLLLATAPIDFDSVNNPDEPFYDFFDTQYLDQLSEEETIELIRLNLEWEERDDILKDFRDLRPRLLSIYRMTGGSPRLILMLYELIANEAIMDVKKQFQILLDRITPYYQDRMNDLGPQERAVLETMALMRSEPKTPSSIATRARMAQNKMSSLLGRLTKSRYIRSEENPDDKRSRLYVIREGFFDIWLAMNVSRGERVRLPFLLDFFEGYYRMAAEGDGSENRKGGYLNEVRGNPDFLVEEAGGNINSPTQGDLDHSFHLAAIDAAIENWEAKRTGDLEAFADSLRMKGVPSTSGDWAVARLEFLENLDEIESTP